jgi:hypothetical protein
MSEPIPAIKGKDIPERITRAIVAAKERYAAEHPNQPHGFTLGKAIDAARAQWRLERPGKVNGRDTIFDAIVEACGGDINGLTRPYSAQVAMAKRDIIEASPTVTRDEILRRAVRYRAKYKDAPCTPLALAKHWPEFPLPKTRASVYAEPVGWNAALTTLAERSKWDRGTTQLMLSAKWSDLTITVREEIMKEMGL